MERLLGYLRGLVESAERAISTNSLVSSIGSIFQEQIFNIATAISEASSLIIPSVSFAGAALLTITSALSLRKSMQILGSKFVEKTTQVEPESLGENFDLTHCQKCVETYQGSQKSKDSFADKLTQLALGQAATLNTKEVQALQKYLTKEDQALQKYLTKQEYLKNTDLSSVKMTKLTISRKDITKLRRHLADPKECAPVGQSIISKLTSASTAPETSIFQRLISYIGRSLGMSSSVSILLSKEEVTAVREINETSSLAEFIKKNGKVKTNVSCSKTQYHTGKILLAIAVIGGSVSSAGIGALAFGAVAGVGLTLAALVSVSSISGFMGGYFSGLDINRKVIELTTVINDLDKEIGNIHLSLKESSQLDQRLEACQTLKDNCLENLGKIAQRVPNMKTLIEETSRGKYELKKGQVKEAKTNSYQDAIMSRVTQDPSKRGSDMLLRSGAKPASRGLFQGPQPPSARARASARGSHSL